ncbi:MAG: GDSL-type esterase/lipase family protein [Hyphomicrobiales bacterium]
MALGHDAYLGPAQRKPQAFDFDRIIPVALASIIVLAGIAVWAFAGFAPESAPKSPLWAYGIIVAGAGVLAAILGRFGWLKLSWLLIVVTSLDLGFGLGTEVLAQLGLKNSFLPLRTVSLTERKRFTYHPLLQGVPTPGFDNGFFVHDADGHRRVDATTEVGADRAGLPRIAVVGGSSTYDLGVRNGETWPDELQRRLTDARVINFGVPGYSTAEHTIQSAFYMKREAIDCAVYYVGWNDIRNSFLPTLDPGYADYHMLDHKDFLWIRTTTGVTSIANFLMNSRFLKTGYMPNKADYRGEPARAGIDPRLEAIYRDNLRNIKAINDAEGRRTVFVAQILNYARLTEASRYGWFPLVDDKDVRPIQEHFNAVLEEVAMELGVPFIRLNADSFPDSDFVDNGHFAKGGATRFADGIASGVRAACNIR